jgi:hypothetical protein
MKKKQIIPFRKKSNSQLLRIMKKKKKNNQLMKIVRKTMTTKNLKDL